MQLVFEHKQFSLIFTPNLSWSKHISAVIDEANQRFGVPKKNKYILSGKSLEIGYFSFIWPIVEYADVIYDSCSKADSGKLENVQLEAAQIVTGCKSHNSRKQLILYLDEIIWPQRKQKTEETILYY